MPSKDPMPTLFVLGSKVQCMLSPHLAQPHSGPSTPSGSLTHLPLWTLNHNKLTPNLLKCIQFWTWNSLPIIARVVLLVVASAFSTILPTWSESTPWLSVSSGDDQPYEDQSTLASICIFNHLTHLIRIPLHDFLFSSGDDQNQSTSYKLPVFWLFVIVVLFPVLGDGKGWGKEEVQEDSAAFVCSNL